MSDEEDATQPGLHFFANLSASLETLAGEVKRANDREQSRLARLPINIPFSQLSNGVSPTNIIDFGGPQPGREWDVRFLAAYASPVAANAAVVSWYVGQNMPGDAAGQLPITMKRWEFSALPGQEKFNTSLLVVQSGEHLLAGLTNIPASSRIGLTVVVADQPRSSARMPVALS